MKKTLRNLTLSLCALSLTSCSDFGAEARSRWFRYNPEENEALYIEIQDGVTGSEDATESLRRLVDGWRRYPPEGGMISLDLDQEQDWEVDPEELPENVDLNDINQLKETVEAFLKAIEVVEAGVFQGPPDHIGFYRVTRIKDLSAFLDGLNTFFNFYLKTEGPDKSYDPIFSEETVARWMERATENKPWVILRGGAFVLDIPMTESEAARVLLASLEESDSLKSLSWLILSLDQIRVADGSLSLAFSPKGNRFHYNETSELHSLNEGHAALVEALESDPGFQEFDRAEVLDRVK